MIERKQEVDFKGILYSFLFGLLVGFVGAHIVGYISAVAIPSRYLSLFNPQFTHLVISVITQFLGFGVLAIIAARVLSGLSSKWIANIAVSYIAFVLYLSFGTAIVYDTQISNYYSGIAHWWLIPSYFVVPACLFFSAFLSSKRNT